MHFLFNHSQIRTNAEIQAPNPINLAAGLSARSQTPTIANRAIHTYAKRAYVGSIVGPTVTVFVIFVIFFFAWLAHHARREERRRLAVDTALVTVAANASVPQRPLPVQTVPTTMNIYTPAPVAQPVQQGMPPMHMQPQHTGQYPQQQQPPSVYQQPQGAPYHAAPYQGQQGYPQGIVSQPQQAFVPDLPPKYGV